MIGHSSDKNKYSSLEHKLQRQEDLNSKLCDLDTFLNYFKPQLRHLL